MKSFLPFLWKKESPDLKLLLILVLTTPLCWIIFLKWNFDLSISSNDATKILFPFYPDLVREHGNWQSTLYRPELLGGFIIEGYFGSYPITRTLAYLGFSPLACLNLTFLTIQILYGFFSIRTALSLKEYWGPGPFFTHSPSHPSSNDSTLPNLPHYFERFARLLNQNLNKLPGYIGLGLLNTFLPVLAWRISYGHPNIISGSFLFLSFFCLILAKQLGNLTFTCISITIIALINCFQYQSHQMVLYSIVFGGPILLGLIWPSRNQTFRTALQPLLLPILISLGAFAYSLEVFWPFFSHAISSDTARSILGENITYSYITATLGDWLSSLPWSSAMLYTERENRFLHHEVNYPIGPILLLLALVPWRTKNKRNWAPLGIGLAISCCMAITFSMNLSPISDLLSGLFPPLKFFRVPARSILPLAFLIPILGSAALLARDQLVAAKSNSRLFLMIGLLVVFFPSETREIFLWLICIFAIIQSNSKNLNQKRAISTGAFLLLLGLGSLFEFRERLLPFRSQDTLETAPSLFKQEIYQQAPQLQSSLTRAILDFEAEPYSLNRGYVLGVSTLAGYFSPPARFLKLFFALGETPPEIMTQVFEFNETTPGYYPLRELYNVAYKAREINGHYQVTQLETNNTEAWFSKNLVGYSSITDIARALRNEGQGLRNYLRNSISYLINDPMINKSQLPEQVSPLCSQAQVLNVHAPQHSQSIDIKVSTPENCPLTVSMNYVEILDAIGKSESGGEEKLKVFPAYGALTGVWVTKGITSIRIEPKAHIPLPVTLTHILGGLLLLSLLAITIKGQLTEYWATLAN